MASEEQTGETRESHSRHVVYNALRNFRIPDRYRTRVFVTAILLAVCVMLRVLLGTPLPVKWLFTGTVYDAKSDNGRTSFVFVSSPGAGFMLLFWFVKFLMQEPARRPHQD